MSLIALMNYLKDSIEQRRTNATFKHLDDHVLRDIGFIRDQGNIRPLSGIQKERIRPPEKRLSDS